MHDWATVLNVGSNISYALASAYCIHHIIKSGTYFKLTIFFAILVGFVATGSSLFHIYETPLAQLSDVIPCWLFMLTYVGSAMYYMLGWSKKMTATCMALFMVSLAITGMFHIEAPSVPWIPGGVMLWVICLVMAKRHTGTAGDMGVAAACFTIALPVKALDPYASMHAVIGTHWVWHIITAIMFVYLITGMHDYLKENKEGPKLKRNSDKTIDVSLHQLGLHIHHISPEIIQAESGEAVQHKI